MSGDVKRVRARLLRPLSRMEVEHLGTVVEQTPTTLVLDVPRGDAGRVVTALERFDELMDISLADPPLEETLRELYVGYGARQDLDSP